MISVTIAVSNTQGQIHCLALVTGKWHYSDCLAFHQWRQALFFLFECQCIQHEIANWGHYIFTSPNGNGTAILRGHPSHAKVSPLAVQREYFHFSVVFKTLSIGPAPGIEPATSRSAVKRSTDWANPAADYSSLKVGSRTSPKHTLSWRGAQPLLWGVSPA